MKMKDLRELTVDELNQKELDLREELFNLRFQQSTNRLENPMKIRQVKRDIARVKTLLTELERGNDAK
ncbi:MAG: 50S ribosomal protein L29 [Candidatus Cloacimonetes bacterium]|nr:50S ribosomal protein L29 [Candidatus Cloacimonadota bacterium]MCF7814352.1 50S ribosomal protein L29 [Candidatus Cloacimonadota bacterium]MCF7868956.1 50S ribosomal protein L29 [Candidatus Cloacimonadota bacterium]MCF7884350.1 50S ribosomal protein L29 [Candidatus Cloacimonadota bacterium]